MSGAVILTPGDRVMLAQAPRKRGYLTPEQQAFDDERRQVRRWSPAWCAAWRAGRASTGRRGRSKTYSAEEKS